MQSPVYPMLYQINTRVVLEEIGRGLDRRATLDDFPDDEIGRIEALGFDWVWLLGIWQTGAAGRQVSRSNPEWRREYEQTLPDLTDDDITGSPFAITRYHAHADFGGDAALERIRKRFEERGIRLMLDFVPNHTALDHDWVATNPEYYVQGTAEDLEREPQNYVRFQIGQGGRVFAHGRDPYFAGWPDTLQLNYRHPALRQAMIDQLVSIAERCDGVRCDMAMLVLPDIFLRTWGAKSSPGAGIGPVDTPFWPLAIDRVHETHPDFVFMAEVYWDLEYTLQMQGFRYTYDKRHYDRLIARNVAEIRGHLGADMAFQSHSARFMENHDEPRARAEFPDAAYEPAAILTYLVPGLRFIHEGQFEGRTKRVSMHLGRRPVEQPNLAIAGFYERLLTVLHRGVVRDGDWRLHAATRAWAENGTAEQFIAFSWRDKAGDWLLVVVNYAPSAGQCYVQLPSEWLNDPLVELTDLVSDAHYERDGKDLAERGLYLDMPGWAYHVFVVTTRG